MKTVKYPHIHVRLVGEDGNAFSILGRVSRALRLGGVPKPEIDAVLEEMKAGDYNHLLRTVMETVSMADDDEEDDE